MDLKTDSDQPAVVLGKTHFRIPGCDQLIAFSAIAIANDQRPQEMVKAFEEYLQRTVESATYKQ